MMPKKLIDEFDELLQNGKSLKARAGDLFGTKKSNLDDSEYVSWLQQAVHSIKKLGKPGEALIRDIENYPDIQFSYEHNIERILGNLKAASQFAAELSMKSPQKNMDKKIKSTKKLNKKVFIIHGHDKTAKQTVARFVEHLGLTPVILHEQANRGRTLMEKVIDHSSDVHFAIALLTPDDVGHSKKAKKNENRARQNVIFELGLFLGILGRRKVVALRKKAVNIPSDYDDVVYIPFDDNDGWKLKLANELKEVFKFIDLNRMR
jgi:predicted nucleotide-binding protein